jgi:membrane-associated protein
MKHLLTFLLLSFCIGTLNAQDSLSFTLINQYKNEVKNAAISINDRNYISNKLGVVTIPLPADDSIVINGLGYKEKTVPVNDLQNDTIVELDKKFSWTDLFTPMFYIIYGGLWMLVLIIFAETGLFIGFFFPGDSLLFVAGILSTPLVGSSFLNTGNDFFNLLIISGLCSIAGILGNIVGYYTGRKVGPAMFRWRDRLLFKKKYLEQSKEFYDKHGGGAIVFARFLPLIRTFAPIVAGIVAMDKKKFIFYNIVGSITWVTSMLFIGHYLNEFSKKQFGIDLEKHLEVIVIGIVLVTTAPVLLKLFFGKRRKPTISQIK